MLWIELTHTSTKGESRLMDADSDHSLAAKGSAMDLEVGFDPGCC